FLRPAFPPFGIEPALPYNATRLFRGGLGLRRMLCAGNRSLLAAALFTLAAPLGAAAQSGNHAPGALPPPGQPTAVAFDAPADGLTRTTNLPPITNYAMMGWFRITGDNHAYSTLLGLSHATSSNAYLVMLCCGNGWDSISLWTGNAFVTGGSVTLGTW